MKKLILIGNVACGKTTLCQYLNGMKLSYKKTQALEVINQTIDTPGEYLEHRAFFRALIVTAVEADFAVFMQDATQERFMFSPGQAASFPVPVFGIVSKVDAATPQQIQRAHELLELAGAQRVFHISSYTSQGMDELVDFLKNGEPGQSGERDGRP